MSNKIKKVAFPCRWLGYYIREMFSAATSELKMIYN